MRSFAKLAALSVVAFASATFAAASTMTIGSYGSTASNAANYSNTATYYYNTNTSTVQSSYNVGTGNVWSAPIGSSSWVSLDPNAYPGGSYVAPNGTYYYVSAFNTVLPTGYSSTGSLTVMADDTTSVYLNGILILAAAAANPASHCTVSSPNCTTPVTVFLPSADFTNGQNILAFGVNQDFGSATGLDYQGSITTTPEPSSLLLLGTGVLSSAGMLRRKFLS